MPDFSTTEKRLAFVAPFATTYNLEPALIAAVIEQESNWDTWAYRWEEQFYINHVLPLGLGVSISHERAASWGLMQVMGQTAREIGFNEDLPSLCEPEKGVDVGCKILKAKMDRAEGNLVQGLLYYNGGGNKQYPVDVTLKMKKYETLP